MRKIRKLKSKKAEKRLWQTLTYLVLALVVLAVLLWFYGGIKKIYEEKEDIEICRKSVEVASMSSIGGGQFYQDLRCPTIYTTIKNKDEEKIKKAIADDMADCAYKFGVSGAGKPSYLFPAGLMDKVLHKINYNCIICSVIEFEGSAKNKNIIGFARYLADSEHKTSGRYGNIPYYEFITRKKLDPQVDLITMLPAEQDSLDTNQRYATLLIYARKGYVDRVLAASLGGVGTFVIAGLYFHPATLVGIAGVGLLSGLGAGGGALIGAEKSADIDVMTLIIPYNEDTFKKIECTTLPVKQETKTT